MAIRLSEGKQQRTKLEDELRKQIERKEANKTRIERETYGVTGYSFKAEVEKENLENEIESS